MSNAMRLTIETHPGGWLLRWGARGEPETCIVADSEDSDALGELLTAVLEALGESDVVWVEVHERKAAP